MARVEKTSIVPEQHGTTYLVLDDLGKLGLVYGETDLARGAEADIVENLMTGQYSRPLRVVAFDVEEGWARDVSEDVARAVMAQADRAGRTLSRPTRDFVERHLDVEMPTEA